MSNEQNNLDSLKYGVAYNQKIDNWQEKAHDKQQQALHDIFGYDKVPFDPRTGPSKPKILFVGPSRCGKDEAGEFLARHTTLRFAGTTSKYLCKYAAAHLGVSEEQAYRERHANKMIWYHIGNAIREADPGKLIKEAFSVGNITGGIRDQAEAEWARDNRDHVDIIIWVQNSNVKPDPTLKFDASFADIVIPNETSLYYYHQRLFQFAKTLGILKPGIVSPIPIGTPEDIGTVNE